MPTACTAAGQCTTADTSLGRTTKAPDGIPSAVDRRSACSAPPTLGLPLLPLQLVLQRALGQEVHVVQLVLVIVLTRRQPVIELRLALQRAVALRQPVRRRLQSQTGTLSGCVHSLAPACRTRS